MKSLSAVALAAGSARRVTGIEQSTFLRTAES